MSMNIRPLHDRVIIEKVIEERTAGGIVIPEKAGEKPQKGKVLAVGPGKEGQKLDVAIGDIVLFGKYSGTEVKVGDSELLVMREEDIMGILES